MTESIEQQFVRAQGLEQKGDFKHAISVYQDLLAKQPQQPDVLHRLGVIALKMQKYSDATTLIQQAIDLRPHQATYYVNLALALKQAGNRQAAQAHLEKAVELKAKHTQAQYHLAEMYFEQGLWDKAEHHYRQALHYEANYLDAHMGLAATLEKKSALSETKKIYEYLIDNFASVKLECLLRLGNIYQNELQTDAAQGCYKKIIELNPDFFDAYHNLGFSLMEAGALDDAIEVYRSALLRKRAVHSPRGAELKTFTQTSRGKLKHDIEQLSYLLQRGLIDSNMQSIIDVYQALLERAPQHEGKDSVFDIPAEIYHKIQPYYNRLLYFKDTPALPGSALNPLHDWPAIEARYHANAPGLLYIDDLLCPEALQQLRQFCLESTLWFDYKFDNGYLGAFIYEGFFSSLLKQVAKELAAAMPSVFKQHPLTHLWGFKYDQNVRGIEMHADFAAVNVNFWLTPDEANLDPNTGGLIVWDKEAPKDWDFRSYNQDQMAMSNFVKQSAANDVRIPHKQNRAVIFNSDLIHKTDEIHFKPGYENRRVNITMLFGRRENDL